MNKTIVALSIFALTLGGLVSWVMLTRPTREAPKLTSTVNADDRPAETWRDRVITPKDGKTPAEAADIEYNSLTNAKSRLELIRWVSEQDWAGHKTPVLRKALIADTDEAVQIAALEKSVKLAEKYGQPSINEVIRAGLSVANPRVIQQSLREARKHPSPELVPDLLEIADSKVDYRFLAIDALAFTDDVRAHAKVIDIASREDGNRNDRLRAIALLCKVKDPRALDLLGQLCGNTDEEIRNVANEALAAYNGK